MAALLKCEISSAALECLDFFTRAQTDTLIYTKPLYGCVDWLASTAKMHQHQSGYSSLCPSASFIMHHARRMAFLNNLNSRLTHSDSSPSAIWFTTKVHSSTGKFHLGWHGVGVKVQGYGLKGLKLAVTSNELTVSMNTKLKATSDYSREWNYVVSSRLLVDNMADVIYKVQVNCNCQFNMLINQIMKKIVWLKYYNTVKA